MAAKVVLRSRHTSSMKSSMKRSRHLERQLSAAASETTSQSSSSSFEKPLVSIVTGDGRRDGDGGGVLVWFRRDLRLHDNEAIYSASVRARELNSRVDFCYVHRTTQSSSSSRDCERQKKEWHAQAGGASLAWLGSALNALDGRLREKWGSGAKLIYRECADDSESLGRTLGEVAEACGSSEIFFGRCYEPHLRDEERDVQMLLHKAFGLRSKPFASYLLFDIDNISIDMSKWKGHFGTLMPFYIACKTQKKVASRGENVFPIPEDLRVRDDPIAEARDWTLEQKSNTLRRFLSPTSASAESDWVAKLANNWSVEGEICEKKSSGGRFGELDALLLLDSFLQEKMRKYENSRGYADARAVSKLSPYIHFGQLSVRYMMSKLTRAGCEKISKTFFRRLVWRDLAYWQMFHWPNMPTQPIRSVYSNHEWNCDEEALRRWQRGETGFPIVDAGMRELWATGWMHQNVRMCCALFLIEYLNIHWVEGAKWFHDTLFDADLAINSMMWQNAGKSGLDHWPMQWKASWKSLDPTGDYIRKWVPELERLPNRFLQEPWEARESDLLQANVHLGVTYPHRISSEGVEIHLKALQKVREIAKRKGYVDDSNGREYDTIPVPRGSCRGSLGGKRIRVYTRRLQATDKPTNPGKKSRRTKARPSSKTKKKRDKFLFKVK